MKQESIISVLEIYFRTNKKLISKNDIKNTDVTSIGNFLVEKSDTNFFELNTKSILLHEILYDFIEKELGEKFINNIGQAINQTKTFFEKKKKELGFGNIVNAYSELIDDFQAYILYLLQKCHDLDIVNYYLGLDKHDRYSIDNSFYQALIYLDLDEVQLYEILNELNDDNTYELCSFCSSLAVQNQERAIKLYEYVKKLENNPINGYIFSSILSGLYTLLPDKAFSLAKELLKTYERAAFVAFAQFKCENKEHIKEIFQLIDSASLELEDVPFQITTILINLINNKLTRNEIKKLCFDRLGNLFKIDDQNLKDYIFRRCQYLEAFEEEKFKLLVNVFLISDGRYFKRISDYFMHYTNPDYFFQLLVVLIQMEYKHQRKIKTNILSNAFTHFWRVNKKRTEELTLELISHDIPILRFAAVELLRRDAIMNEYYPIQLLNLDSQLKQLRASEALMYASFYKIEQILPLLISLKESPYKLVVEYIQSKLSYLILYGYNEHLWNSLLKLTNDEAFLKPLKKSIEDYRKIKKAKESINDLNPYSNERDWMQMYYQLDDEKMKNMQRETTKNDPFPLEMFAKTTIIVRGDSWGKSKDDVTPLGEFGYSLALDMRMYKDPDLFDWEHDEFNFNSQF